MRNKKNPMTAPPTQNHQGRAATGARAGVLTRSNPNHSGLSKNTRMTSPARAMMMNTGSENIFGLAGKMGGNSPHCGGKWLGNANHAASHGTLTSAIAGQINQLIAVAALVHLH